jgi:RNA polymerase sigma-70 factor (ECF subfamily)
MPGRPGKHQRHPAAGDPSGGLRALALLVAQARAALAREPALAAQLPFASAAPSAASASAGRGGHFGLARGPLGPLLSRMSVSVGADGGRPGTSGRPHRPGGGRRRRAALDTDSTDSAGATDSSVDSLLDLPIDDQHAESWRLVRASQQGDGEAFGQLYDRYVDTVYRFIQFRVNDRTLAEDFTSETFLRALRRIHAISYQGRDVGAWFVTIARNIVFDHTKSARHRLEVSIPDPVEGGQTAPSPEAEVIAGLTAQRLMAAIAELSEEQRECVVLRFMQGFSVSETAEVMGKNDGAIKALQHRAVRKLADLVGDELR